jgi:hypothetical protein
VVIRGDGRKVQVRIDGNWKITIEPEKQIKFIHKVTAHGPRGDREAEPNSGTVTLDEQREVRSRGGGEATWTFADGALTFVRTLPAGAYRMTLSFVGSADGLSCEVREAFAREGGKGQIKMQSPFRGGEVTIVSAKHALNLFSAGVVIVVMLLLWS